MGRKNLHILGIALGIALQGCVFLPFAVPPVQLQGGGGGRLIRPAPVAPAVGVGMLRVGLHPMQLYVQKKPRWWDVGTGYVLDYNENYMLHGGYLDGAIFFVRDKNGRLGIHAQPRIMVDDDGHGGGGLALQFTGEIHGFTKGDFQSSGSDGFIYGSAYGEGGIGFFMEASGAVVNSISTTSFGLGLQVRIPAAGGIMWAVLK